MSPARAYFVPRSAAGIALSMLASLRYAMALSYTNGLFVYAATALSFALFSAPVWKSLFRRPVQRWLAYYLLVAIIPFLGIMSRFVFEALSAGSP